MSFFPTSQIEAMVDAETVSVAATFKIDLASETLYFAEGTVGYTDTNGQAWGGMHAGLVRFDDISYGYGVVAEKRTYTLDAGALPELAMSMVGQEQEYRWRPITQFLQFFLDNSQPVGAPIHAHTGLMDRLNFSMSPGGSASTRLTTETEFARKNASAYGYFTDTDQKARFPDDRAFERVSLLSLGEAVKWPDF